MALNVLSEVAIQHSANTHDRIRKEKHFKVQFMNCELVFLKFSYAFLEIAAS
jgi:hypothetical protein